MQKLRDLTNSIEKLRSFGAKRARHTQGMRAEAAHMHRTTSDTRLQLFCVVCRRWARVVRKKCVEFHRNFRDFKRNRKVFPQISVQKALPSSG